MVESMHNDSNDQHEEEALDRAMTSIDPILQASLRREQSQRRVRLFLWGGLAMIVSCVCVAVLLSTAGVSGNPSDTDTVSAAEKAEALAAEGWQLWKTGKPAEAERKFLAATKLDRKLANAWNGLGWARIHQQKSKAAGRAFSDALKIQKNHPGALNGLGQVYFNLGELTKAEKVFRRAQKMAPAAEVGLARVLLLQKKFKEAAPILAKILKGATGDLDRELLEEMQEAADSEEVSDELAQRIAPFTPSSEVADQKNGKKLTTQDATNANARGWQLFQRGPGVDRNG